MKADSGTGGRSSCGPGALSGRRPAQPMGGALGTPGRLVSPALGTHRQTGGGRWGVVSRALAGASGHGTAHSTGHWLALTNAALRLVAH